MNPQTKTYVLGAIGLIIIAGLLWWGNTQRQSNDMSQLRIGGLFALTGYASFAGEASRDGFLMAIEDSGMDVSYVVEDYQSDLVKVSNAARKLVDEDRVPIVIGPDWNAFSEVVGPIADEKKVVFVSPWMTSEGSILDYEYFFTATPSEREETRKLVEVMSEEGHKRISLIYSNEAWSLENAQAFKEEIRKYSEIDIIQELKVNHEESDYRSQVALVNQASPDALYAIISSNDGHGQLARQLKESGFAQQVYVPNGRGSSSDLLDKFGSVVEGTIYPAPKEFHRMEEFRRRYRDRFGTEPGAISAATAYDLTTIVLNAMKGGARNSEEIHEYLVNLKNYEGYSNNIRFDERGQVVSGGAVIMQIRNGELVPYDPTN